MKTLKSVKTVLIGAGNMGKNHARVYNQISHFCALSDVNRSLGEKMAKQYNVTYYENFETMLDKEKPDAVSVVVPTQFHKEVVHRCLKRKIPTLVEKPIALSYSEAKSMMHASKIYDTYLLVGHIERFNPAIHMLKKLIHDNKIGKIISMFAMRVGISPPNVPHANVLLDLGIHDVDICNFLVDEYPKKLFSVKQKIYSNSDVDSATVYMTYSQCSAVIITNWITPIKMRRLYITGTDGFIELDYINQKIIFYNKIAQTIPDGDYYKFISLSQNPQKSISISKREPLKEELIYFLKHRNDGFDKAGLYASIEALKIVTK